jgi:hypothetical protein
MCNLKYTLRQASEFARILNVMFVPVSASPHARSSSASIPTQSLVLLATAGAKRIEREAERFGVVPKVKEHWSFTPVGCIVIPRQLKQLRQCR